MNIFSRIKDRGLKVKVHVANHPEWGPVTYKRIPGGRRLRLSALPFKGLLVNLPAHLSIKQAEPYLQQKRDWIKTILEHCQDVEAKSEAFYSTTRAASPIQVRTMLVTRLTDLAQEYGFQFGKVSIRDQKTRWGSCSSANNISLNQKLQFLPPHLIDYILLHELAHTREKNHSERFWAVMHAIMGNQMTRQARRELRDYEFLFYPPDMDEKT